jgi:DNA repair exonuclease SbcCD nuclease subunit
MKIVIYSDLHLYNHHRLLVNSETALNFLSYIKKYALDNSINTIISAGDFFHTKAKAYAPHVVQGWLRVKDMYKSKLKHYMIVGNHDMANPENTMNSILFLYSDYAKIIPDYFWLDTEKTRIHMLSYSISQFDFENFVLAEDKHNVLVAHLDIVGFMMPNGFKSNTGYKVEDFKMFDLVISGHYHKFQTRDNVIYVGSPYQTSFAEREQPHGFLILDTDTVQWEFIENLSAPKYKVIEVRKIEDIPPSEINGNFVKAKILSRNISKDELRDYLFKLGAISAEVIPPEDVKEIEKYYDKALGNDPIDVASAYLKSLTDLPFENQELMKAFAKIAEVSNNITDYEV